jgi:hypothetical protein
VTPLREALEQAKADPATFAAGLSPETLQRLKALAVKISEPARWTGRISHRPPCLSV